MQANCDSALKARAGMPAFILQSCMWWLLHAKLEGWPAEDCTEGVGLPLKSIVYMAAKELLL